MQNCRHSDELTFFSCLDRQEVAFYIIYALPAANSVADFEPFIYIIIIVVFFYFSSEMSVAPMQDLPIVTRLAKWSLELC